MSGITTHVLDIVLGKPAAGVVVKLQVKTGDTWRTVGTSATDTDGRCREWLDHAAEGVYRLTFYTGEYLKGLGRATLYPEITVVFQCRGDAHYHLPILLSDNGYTTYRGS